MTYRSGRSQVLDDVYTSQALVFRRLPLAPASRDGADDVQVLPAVACFAMAL